MRTKAIDRVDKRRQLFIEIDRCEAPEKAGGVERIEAHPFMDLEREDL